MRTGQLSYEFYDSIQIFALSPRLNHIIVVVHLHLNLHPSDTQQARSQKGVCCDFKDRGRDLQGNRKQ